MAQETDHALAFKALTKERARIPPSAKADGPLRARIMGTTSYRFYGAELPTADGRTEIVDGCAVVHGHDTWKIVSLSVDGRPVICERCRALIKAWLHAAANAGLVAAAIRRAETYR